MKSLPANHLACENPTSTQLDFKSKASIIDWNLKVSIYRFNFTLFYKFCVVSLPQIYSINPFIPKSHFSTS